jgi:MYXO-CTERM domain-containing protein
MLPRAAIVALALVAVPRVALAHMRLVDPPPINTNLANGSSCGPADANAVRTQLVAGSMVNVHWIEVQQHDGTFRLSFSPNDRVNFTTLVDNIPHPTDQPLPRMFSQIITVPDTPCSSCTLQFGLNEGGGLDYVSCADIEIVAAPPPSPDASVPLMPDASLPVMGMDAAAAPVDSGTSTDPSMSVDAGVTMNPPPSQPPPAPMMPPPSMPSPPPAQATGPSTTPMDQAVAPQASQPMPLAREQANGTIEGGCRCVVPRSPPLSSAALLALGATLFLGRRRRN